MHKLSMQEFATVLKKELCIRYPELDIAVETISKINGINLTALQMRSEKSNMAPVIYLDSYFEDYENGVGILTIVNQIVRVYEENRTEGQCFDVEKYLDYNNIKERICFKLVNAKKNTDLLSSIPHRIFHDLAVVYFILLPNENERTELATIVINNVILNMWKVSENELHQVALTNSVKYLKSVVRPLSSIVSDVSCDDCEILQNNDSYFNPEEVMFLVSNQYKVYGAGTMLYKELLFDFGRLYGDFYLLPSSIHDVLFVPVDRKLTPEFLLRMVKDVN